MSTRLIPPSSPLTQPYWDATRRGQLVTQKCEPCERRIFPPQAHCPNCGSAAFRWEPVSGKGVIYTYTIAHRPPHPVLADQCPLAIAVVELQEGPRMITNVVGCNPGEVEIGMKVQVTFEAIDDSDEVLPVFQPAW
jgi:uncharacterized OB-fold protein